MARIAFCQDTLIEYMAYMQMASVLEEHGHTVEIFIDDGLHSERFRSQVTRFRPDIVGFSVLTPSRTWATTSARALRASTGAVTVCGNVDAILNPEPLARSGAFDLVCTGEGEVPMTTLCAAVDKGEDWSHINGFWTVREDEIIRNPKEEELVDMDVIPPINREIYDKFRFFRRSPYLRVYVGRGCPFRCSFCSNTTMTDAYGGSRYLRKKTPEGFIGHLEELIASRPNKIKRIFLIDEVLWFDRKWLREFLELYRDRIKVPFTMHFKFNGGTTEDDVRLMGEAGAALIIVAAETGDEELRKGLMNKPVTNAHILKVSSWMRKYGITYGGTAFFGLPGQTFEHHLEELDFYREMGGYYLWSTFFQPYPGLNLTKDPTVAPLLPEIDDFDETLHTAMYLDLPDRTRLVNLKKVYFLMFKYPKLEKPLAWLCRFKIPAFFDAVFIAHFAYYYFVSEGCSAYQFAVHIRDFALNPALRKIQPLNTSGLPFDPGYDDAPPEPAVPLTEARREHEERQLVAVSISAKPRS